MLHIWCLSMWYGLGKTKPDMGSKAFIRSACNYFLTFYRACGIYYSLSKSFFLGFGLKGLEKINSNS